MADLDPGIFEEIKRIFSLGDDQIISDNLGFLKARLSYLTGEQVQRLESLLKVKPTEAKEPKEVIGKKK